MRAPTFVPASGRGSTPLPTTSRTRPLAGEQDAEPLPSHSCPGPRGAGRRRGATRRPALPAWRTIRQALVTAVVVALGLVVGYLGFMGVGNGG